MYCSYCGNKIPTNSKYCNFCGKRVSNNYNLSKSNRYYILLYIIWAILNVVALASGNSCRRAKSHFFPFSLNCAGASNTCPEDNNIFASYDWSELFVYTLIIPIIVYFIYTIFKEKTAKNNHI